MAFDAAREDAIDIAVEGDVELAWDPSLELLGIDESGPIYHREAAT